MRIYPALRLSQPQQASEFADLVAAALDGFGVIALQDDDDGSVVAYLADAGARQAATEAARAALPGVIIESLDVPDENWAERSQATITAIRAGDLVVAPPWDAPVDLSRAVIIVPSMGFGTGHHATTRMCLEALQVVSPAGKSIIDVGTGSGVLALAAMKLGAARAVGIDNDPDAIANARENMAVNGLSVDFRCAALGPDTDALAGVADVVLANLTGAVLVRCASDLKSLCRFGAHMILSGLREEEERDVLAAFGDTPADRRSEDGWVCVTVRTQA